ncbi:similar to Saccharomyces cerevisiae YMR040W YET2 Protein of unknown function that may interact with ribosomes, based on co- purification experiments [Maudiozyma barnettii]|uniref:Endoplasmic reticulum transmembrane protein n=1 Tax=Maudiozyma barnettii TaxID=61262 RepID=A0A8H2VJC2_9SACH|nr:uncharacterized protein KABA2_09S04730 [Kazachstania barnettii]CAB4256441.1 similar to Saccharomyces cerevisiae YMR040W YET2 Protein of unknown function that may interact with ribosomes, based on co- purification experiments [Kazachstania barnettii]CAD1785050.1 similar to Saccharomyces cerevisiae YMR040W YET2 Protein of unknown function that may interact with ribosomes, based on co- purification experiments [Kazachstania barnettii]
MSLYFTLLFALLTVEMAVLFVLVLPLPNKIRKLLYNTYQRLYHNQQVKTVTIILSIIVGLLFIDSWKRAQVNVTLYRHQNYNQDDRLNIANQYDSHAVTPTQALASRAYNQRNVYISGFILYFMVGIPTVMSIVRRLVKYQDLISNKKTQEKDDSEIIRLKKELDAKTVDVETLQKQVTNAEKYFDEQNKPKTETVTKTE